MAKRQEKEPFDKLTERALGLLVELCEYADEGAIVISDETPREFRGHIHSVFEEARWLTDEAAQKTGGYA